MALNKDLKVSLLAICSVIAFVLIYKYMLGSLFNTSDPIYSSILTNVTSLKKSDKVFVNGVQVGIIKDIKFNNPANPKDVKIDFSVSKDLKVPLNTTVEIISVSLMGTKGIKLNFGNSNSYAEEKNILKGIDEKNIIEDLTTNINPLTNESTKMMTNVNTLFDKSQNENLYITIVELNKSLAALHSMMSTTNNILAVNQATVNASLKNVEKLTNALASKHSDIAEIIGNSKSMTAQLKNSELTQSINNMNKTMSELNKLVYNINEGNGTMGKLMKDEALYDNLKATTLSANKLLIDLKENPKRYVNFSLIGRKN